MIQDPKITQRDQHILCNQAHCFVLKATVMPVAGPIGENGMITNSLSSSEAQLYNVIIVEERSFVKEM